MSKIYPAVMFLSIGLLIGCSHVSEAGADERSQMVSSPATANQRTALGNLVDLFESEKGKHWSAYRSATGVSWNADSPDEYYKGRYEQSGHLVLGGFGSAKLPNGKVGIDYAEIVGNEGQSGVTLNGTRDIVEDLSVKKFYFSENYENILRQQFSESTVITKIADQCAPDENVEIDGGNAFFEIQIPGRKAAYVEAWLQDGGKYSPGYTVFDFYREKPADRIGRMKCR